MPTSMFTDAYKVLVDVLVQVRKDAGVTQTELGRRLGKGQKYVSVIETGVRRIDLIEFTAFARAMGIDPLALYGRLLALFPDQLDM
ncbi:MAG: helix-turn-helix transcriptional regulator [Fimbriimonadaceae bacterium]